jgi:hypothetical protein
MNQFKKNRLPRKVLDTKLNFYIVDGIFINIKLRWINMMMDKIEEDSDRFKHTIEGLI